MITEEQFWRIQALLGRAIQRRRSRHAFPYRGLISCGECKAAVTVEEKWQIICGTCKGKFAAQNKTCCPGCGAKIAEMSQKKLLHYVYYHCTKKKGPCSQKGVTIENLETYPAWLTCMQLGEGGLNIFVTGLTTDRVTIHYEYEAPKTLPTTPFVKLPKPTVLGADLEGSKWELPASGKLPRFTALPTFRRRKGEEFRLTAALGDKSYVVVVPPEPKIGSYRKKCVITLDGNANPTGIETNFVGVAPNYPPRIWTTSCPSFAPGAKLDVLVEINFHIPDGATFVSVAPYWAEGDWVKGTDMIYQAATTTDTGFRSSTVTGVDDGDGVATVGIYIGAAGQTVWNDRSLSAGKGSKITIMKH